MIDITPSQWPFGGHKGWPIRLWCHHGSPASGCYFSECGGSQLYTHCDDVGWTIYVYLLCVTVCQGDKEWEREPRWWTKSKERQDGRSHLLEDDVTEDWSVEETTRGLNKQWRNAVDLTWKMFADEGRRRKQHTWREEDILSRDVSCCCLPHHLSAYKDLTDRNWRFIYARKWDHNTCLCTLILISATFPTSSLGSDIWIGQVSINNAEHHVWLGLQSVFSNALRMFLTFPLTNCEAERSFCHTARMKTVDDDESAMLELSVYGKISQNSSGTQTFMMWLRSFCKETGQKGDQDQDPVWYGGNPVWSKKKTKGYIQYITICYTSIYIVDIVQLISSNEMLFPDVPSCTTISQHDIAVGNTPKHTSTLC